jgi:hypothetical protein
MATGLKGNDTIAAAVGATAFAAAQGIWSLGHAYAGWKGTWMLKSGSGIVFGLAVLAITAAVICALQRKPNTVVNCAVFVAIGAIAAMTVALFLIGPGNLWPIVIAFDGAMIGVAVAVGALIGKIFARR